MDLSILKKIRCRFLDRSTGMPVPGVIASLSVGVGDATNSAKLPVATLCTDATGYMSFDLKPLIDLELVTISGLFITAPQFGLTNYDLLGSLVAAPHDGAEKKDLDRSGFEKSYIGGRIMMPAATTTGEEKALACIVFPIYLENRLRDERGSENAICEPTHLPSIQSPDVCDYKVSPFSFVTPAALKLSNDCCEILLPSSTPIQQYRFYKVIRRDDASATGVAINVTPLKSGVTVVGALTSQAAVIKFGEILEYRQDWYSLGHSLGEIKYSLPLAPGESTQLAVIEWSRDDLASRTDKIRATEFLDHDSRRDRAIEETVEAALREEQGGNSHMGSTSGTASGATYGTGMWTGNHAFGGGISYSYGNRYLEADSLHDLHDRVRQTSSSIRSLNSTVIVQGTQTETNALQTRRVANHNHCHAMTIQYYEVLRHYRMSTKFSGRRKAILIPFEPFAFTSSDFPPRASWDLALRFRTVLEQTLLDPSLRNCFEALIRLHLAPSVYGAPLKPVVEVPKITKEKTETVRVLGTAESGVGSDVSVKAGDMITIRASGEVVNWRGIVDQHDARGPEGIPEIADTRFIAPGLKQRSLVFKIGNGEWIQGASFVTHKVEGDGGQVVFALNDMMRHFDDNYGHGKDFWTVKLSYPSHETEPTPTDPSKDDAANSKTYRKSDDELCEARLLRHLQDNQGFYNGAVWLLMDVVERRLYLEQALHDRLDILDAIDDRPIALSGNYVAFQYSGPLAQWSDSREDDPKVPIDDIVTLPTRGLFAEAQMGHCNSCEKRDVTRMWDWTEMTAETPPEIGGITPGPKGVAPSITPGQLPTNVIQITQPQAAPDPTGLANALSVLKTPDIFRDMAGLDEVSKLLGELAKASGDANSKAMALQAKEKVDGMKKPAAKGSGGTDSAGTSNGRTEPNEKDAASQVDKLRVIEDAKQQGRISDREASNAALGVLGGEVIPAVAVDRNIGMPMGIDVSHHQGNIDWDRVASSSIYFAFIKASDGLNIDTKFQTNWTKARDSGLICGAYHFWLPQVSGKKQAETLIRQLGFLQRGDLPPILDVDDGPHANFAGLSVADLENNIQEFLDTVQSEFGVAPIIYTYPGFWTSKLGNSTKFSSYLLWIANYSPKNEPTLPGGWPTWEFWQLTDSGRVDGVSGFVDMDLFNGNLESLWQMVGRTPKGITI